MAEVTIVINGRNYDISCDDGQEKRILELGTYIDGRFKEISGAGAATNENHLLALTSLVIADELFTAKDQLNAAGSQVEDAASFKEEEAAIAGAIDTLADRIESIAERVQGA